jgi:uncharacterized membrane protein (UPF0127 family)
MNRTLLHSFLVASLVLGTVVGGCNGKEAEEPTAQLPKGPPQTISGPANAAVKGRPRPAATDNPKRIYQLKDFKTGTVTIKQATFKVWLADEPGKEQEGMMWLTEKEVPDDHGMLFPLPGEPKVQRFWMRNCPLGLDLIFIDKAKKIVNIGFGKPFDESGVESTGPASYVLELKAGTAKRKGIKAGDTVVMDY